MWLIYLLFFNHFFEYNSALFHMRNKLYQAVATQMIFVNQFIVGFGLLLEFVDNIKYNQTYPPSHKDSEKS